MPLSFMLSYRNLKHSHTKAGTEKAVQRKIIRKGWAASLKSITNRAQWVTLGPPTEVSGNSLPRPGSMSPTHPVISRLWEYKQTEFFSVLNKNRKSQVASLCSQLGSPALGVQDAQRA